MPSNQSITVRIPHADREALDRLATERGVNRSDLFREAVSRVIAASVDGAADLPAVTATGPTGPPVEGGLAAVRDLPDTADRPEASLAGALFPTLQRIASDLGPPFEQLVAIVQAAWDLIVALFKRGVEAMTGAVPAPDAVPDQREPAVA